MLWAVLYSLCHDTCPLANNNPDCNNCCNNAICSCNGSNTVFNKSSCRFLTCFVVFAGGEFVGYSFCDFGYFFLYINMFSLFIYRVFWSFRVFGDIYLCLLLSKCFAIILLTIWAIPRGGSDF